MKLQTRIALKYIFPFRSFHFITVISTISIIGIIVGVAAIICVTSIFNGFREFAENQLISFDPHIRISAQKGAWLSNYDSILTKIKNIEHINAVAPILQGRIVAIKNTNIQVVTLNAVRQEEIKYVSGIEKTIFLGKFNLKDDVPVPRVVIGAFLADKLRALPGDTLTLMSPALIESAIRTFSYNFGLKVRVSGIFQTNNREYDESYIYSSSNIGRTLFKVPQNTAFSLDIRLDNINNVNKVKKELQNILPSDLLVQSWYDLHKELFDIMQLERLAAFIVLSLIIIIAVFNVLASLSMTVIEKHQDIGVLKAIGAKDSFIRNIYLMTGSFIGFISTFLGTILGLGLCYGQIYFAWFKLDRAKFLIHSVPVTVHSYDIIIVVIFSLFISFIASIYPSYNAAKIPIIQAIREE